MKKVSVICLIFMSLITISCSSILLKKLGVDSDEVLVEDINVEGKEVVFVGIRHIGTESYYLNMKNVIDGLLKKDYHFILEGNYLKRSDKKIVDKNDSTNLKKFRKIIGIDPTMEFSDQKIFKEFFKKHRLKDQPDYTYFNLDYSNSENLDLQYSEIISIFESNKGNVVLSDCDRNTSLGQEYKCKKLSKDKINYLKNKIILEERNDLIINKLKKSNYPKIAIIYGEKHLDGIVKHFQ